MSTTETLLMQQYHEMKKKHPDAVILFRVGETYQALKEDAMTLIDVIGEMPYMVNNTETDGDIVYTEFPAIALDEYIPQLVRAGKRVAICEQLKDNKPTEKTANHNQNRQRK